jgi:hypothetical protein
MENEQYEFEQERQQRIAEYLAAITELNNEAMIASDKGDTEKHDNLRDESENLAKEMMLNLVPEMDLSWIIEQEIRLDDGLVALDPWGNELPHFTKKGLENMKEHLYS